MARLIGGIVAGAVLALLVILVVEAIGHGLFPMAPGGAATRMPPGLMLLVLAGWTLGSFVGGYAADRIARRGLAGYVVAALIAAAGVWTMVELPHPLWMQVGGVLLPFAAAFAAERLARRRF